MADLSVQLYSFPTPNGVKVSIALEEIGLPYEAHTVNIMANETWTPEFLSLNPNGKIPAILDPRGPDGKPLALWESGAILLYLAEKTGKLLPTGPAARYETIQWVFFQMAGVGPMFGQLGFFHKFAGREIEDKRPLERYRAESKRLLDVLEKRLDGRCRSCCSAPTTRPSAQRPRGHHPDSGLQLGRPEGGRRLPEALAARGSAGLGQRPDLGQPPRDVRGRGFR
jgi:glutathione S-transferase